MFTYTTLKEELTIEQVVTIHYFELLKDYKFTGERHDFWEFLYVDKGTMIVQTDHHEYALQQGEIIFHKPNEWHNHIANGLVAPNIMVVSFVCHSPSICFFENRILQVGDTEKDILATILREAGDAFEAPFNDPFSTCLMRKKRQTFGCEQIIRISLESLLLYMIRAHSLPNRSPKLSTSMRENTEKDILNKVLSYLQGHIREKISLEDVCRYTMFSRSYIQRLFKVHMNTSIMDYYKHLKIEEAKTMIREGQYNFTQISEQLSYASIHHFSRHFKEITGMTPSEYASSVKVKI